MPFSTSPVSVPLSFLDVWRPLPTLGTFSFPAPTSGSPTQLTRQTVPAFIDTFGDLMEGAERTWGNRPSGAWTLEELVHWDFAEILTGALSAVPS
ncbi:MAG TPA: hypothetical protein VFX30_04200 [bacterium]|nr:hypothetical protein [bacterium]